jgi:hypothetical protein
MLSNSEGEKAVSLDDLIALALRATLTTTDIERAVAQARCLSYR